MRSEVNWQSCGFCSIKYPPAVEQLAVFEEEIRLIIKNIKFRNLSNKP